MCAIKAITNYKLLKFTTGNLKKTKWNYFEYVICITEYK